MIAPATITAVVGPAGTGKTTTMAAVRAAIVAKLGDGARTAPILYGGSVKAENARELLGADEVGGALVGGASLTAESFLGFVDVACIRLWLRHLST